MADSTRPKDEPGGRLTPPAVQLCIPGTEPHRSAVLSVAARLRNDRPLRDQTESELLAQRYRATQLLHDIEREFTLRYEEMGPDPEEAGGSAF